MRLNAVEAGQGASGAAPVVLLHGLFGAAQNFGAIQKALAASHRVIALDLRNHGASPHAAEMGYPAMAQDVAETLAAFGAAPAAVVGHSMGGKAAMALALAHPALVARLVVADIAPVAYPPGFRAYAEAMAALPLHPGLTRREADALLAPVVPDAGVRAFLLQNLRFDGGVPAWRIGLAEVAAALPVIEAFDGIPAGATYAGPTLFLGGARSDYIRPDHHATIRIRLPHAEFATVPDAGHWVHAENPAGFLAALTPFLERA